MSNYRKLHMILFSRLLEVSSPFRTFVRDSETRLLTARLQFCPPKFESSNSGLLVMKQHIFSSLFVIDCKSYVVCTTGGVQGLSLP
jgi:hypothetical protein